MYIQVGSNGEKKRVKELIFSMILEWEFKETGKIANVFMESGFSQMEKFTKETLKMAWGTGLAYWQNKMAANMMAAGIRIKNMELESRDFPVG